MQRRLEAIGREWLDTLVVALSVAMAFRAYFYEPFNIPTGSMQPTLYGNHYEPCEKPGTIQKTPLRWMEWLLTGRHYKEFVAPFSGRVLMADRGDGRFDLRIVSPSGVQSKSIALPNDAVAHINFGSDVAGSTVVARAVEHSGGRLRVAYALRPGETVPREIRVAKGVRMFSGYDTTGDFIFVNRWLWNFRKPKRGDVMVFSTTGIDSLAQGTHYIKRLVALPGETIEIKPGMMTVDGCEIEGGAKPASGARGENMPPPEPGAMKCAATLADGEYFACGDNSSNSFDSRYWGAVPEDNMRGVGSCVFWPLINARWGRIR